MYLIEIDSRWAYTFQTRIKIFRLEAAPVPPSIVFIRLSATGSIAFDPRLSMHLLSNEYLMFGMHFEIHFERIFEIHAWKDNRYYVYTCWYCKSLA